VQLTEPRDQLSRVSARLKQLGGLESPELAWEVFAFSHVGVSAALESAFTQASRFATEKLRAKEYSALAAAQLAVVAESSFIAFFDGERVRDRRNPKKALKVREALVTELRGIGEPRSGTKSVLQSGNPGRDHFRLFFEIVSGGEDPRGPDARPPLPRLVNRVDQIRGPRNAFAHECVEPSQYEFVAGKGNDRSALVSAVAALEAVIADLVGLFDALEAACAGL
jgi:hypothetical protein